MTLKRQDLVFMTLFSYLISKLLQHTDNIKASMLSIAWYPRPYKRFKVMLASIGYNDLMYEDVVWDVVAPWLSR